MLLVLLSLRKSQGFRSSLPGTRDRNKSTYIFLLSHSKWLKLDHKNSWWPNPGLLGIWWIGSKELKGFWTKAFTIMTSQVHMKHLIWFLQPSSFYIQSSLRGTTICWGCGEGERKGEVHQQQKRWRQDQQSPRGPCKSMQVVLSIVSPSTVHSARGVSQNCGN